MSSIYGKFLAPSPATKEDVVDILYDGGNDVTKSSQDILKDLKAKNLKLLSFREEAVLNIIKEYRRTLSGLEKAAEDIIAEAKKSDLLQNSIEDDGLDIPDWFSNWKPI